MSFESLIMLAQIRVSTGGVVGIVILILQIVAIISVLLGNGSTGHKVLWTLVILLVPVFGVVLYFVLGRNTADRPLME